jgi:signal-transduction protein with cAMP-binding, CBS, and nucleotidyltransferase domain
MTPEPLTITEDTALEEIVQVMERNNVKRSPVIRGDKIVGIASRANLLQRRSPVRHCPKGSDRDRDNIPSVVSKIDHDVRSRRRKLVLSPHCLWLPFGY